MMNPTDHDAPVIQLLSIKHNPLVAQMTPEQLTELVMKLRHRNQPLSPPKPPASKAAQAKALRDSL